jgi:predicted nucleic acid-binding protein
MTAVIADTDILSAFGKVGRLDLLHILFQQLFIAPAVHHELLRAERLGFVWVARVKQASAVLTLTDDEQAAAERLVNLYPQLGRGEIESFVLAQTRRLLCLTNDRQAKGVARTLNLPFLDLEDILRALKRQGVVTWREPSPP